MKTHYWNGTKNVCGQPATARRDGSLNINTNTFSVTCGSCILRNAFQEDHQKAVLAREEAFKAQTPRTIVPQFGRVNDDGVMECPKCTGVLWRERPRDLWSYHYVCDGCGHSVHPLTETGMSS